MTKSALEAFYVRCAIQIDTFTFTFTTAAACTTTTTTNASAFSLVVTMEEYCLPMFSQVHIDRTVF